MSEKPLEAIQWFEFSQYQIRRVQTKFRHLIDQCDNDVIWTSPGQSQSSIGSLVLHTMGTLDQWVISPRGGYSKGKRNRAKEFSPDVQKHKDTLVEEFEKMIEKCIETLRDVYLNDVQFINEMIRMSTVYTSYGMGVMNCVSHAHGHMLQMNTIAKILIDSSWIEDPTSFTDPNGGW
jgi:hypothetical protein